ncbi:MAG: hypothetical protein ABI693_13565 [Bryobacteraceae bacterium]
MATAAQIEANRANATHSTGPTTGEGKASSSRNAFKHGLTSTDLCVGPDQQEEFDAFKDELLEDLTPGSAVEFVLFNQVLSASWRLLRCDRTEAAILGATGADPLLSPVQFATLNTIYKVRGQATSQLHKALAELRKIQTELQYRDAAMPESEGYEPEGLGLANWQSIRQAIKREHGRDLRNQRKNKPGMGDIDQYLDEMQARLSRLQRAAFAGRPETTGAKTNPIAATAAA